MPLLQPSVLPSALSRPRGERRACLRLLTATALLAPLAVLGAPGPARAAAPASRLVPGTRALLRGGPVQADTVVRARPRTALRGGARAVSAAGATFVVSYTGFTPAQRDAFQLAVDTWSDLISSSVPIRIDARLTTLPDGVLGSAGPTDFVVQDTGSGPTMLPVALGNARAGKDLDPGQSDISADFSNDPSLFSFGTGPSKGRYDFTTVVLHEIAHGLGFAGAMEVVRDRAGAQRGYWDAGTTAPLPLAYDRYTVTPAADGTVTRLLALGRGSARLAGALTSAVRWDGRVGVRAAGGTRPVLYAPSRWEEGSSYSHLDEDTYPAGSPDSLMTPVLDLGEVVRDPGSVALGMLADVGWGSDPAPVRLSGPASVQVGGTVTLSGAAAGATAVTLSVRPRGAPAFRPLRVVPVVGGRFTTTLIARDDARYSASAGGQVAATLLVQVRPVLDGPTTRVVRRGATVTVSGRAVPGTPVRLTYLRGGVTVAVRTVTTTAAGTFSRTQVLTGDLRVVASGSNGRPSDTSLLLRAR